jgi:hypothetical protein
MFDGPPSREIAQYEAADGSTVLLLRQEDGRYTARHVNGDGSKDVQSNMPPDEVVGYLCHCLHATEYRLRKSLTK